MTYSGTAILAFIVNFIINYDILRKVPAKEIAAQSAYRKFIFHVMIFYVSDGLWGIVYEQKLMLLTYIDTMIFFTAMVLSILYWTHYVVEYLNANNKYALLLKYAGNIMLLFEIIMLIINIFRPVLFSLNNGVYQAEEGRYVLLIFQIIMFIATSVYVISKSTRLDEPKKYRYRAIGAFGISMVIFLYVQTLYPLMPYYSIGCLIGGCLLHTFVVEDERNEYITKLETLSQKNLLQKLEIGSEKILARTDSLTGAKNKLAFAEKEKEINQMIAAGVLKEFAVVVCDVNNLKGINDTNGHNAGDKYLKSAYQKIADSFEGLCVYRIGGDEFSVLIDSEKYNRKNQMIEKLRDEKNMIAFGVAEYLAGKDIYFTDIFERADQEMYKQKRTVKNFTCSRKAD